MPLEQDLKLARGIFGQELRPHRDHFPPVLPVSVQAAFELFLLVVVGGYFFEGIFPIVLVPLLALEKPGKTLRQICLLI